jgi:hypothetical protein
MSNFYDDLDFKYPEIGIAIENIDRRKSSQSIKFIIPVLTPNINNGDTVSRIVHQNRANLMNDSRHRFEINDIVLTNYTEIPIPREVLGYDSENDIICSGSKWIIVFVGGDITKPRVIARYLD